MRKVQPNTEESKMAGEYDTVTRILLEHCAQDWLTALAPQLHLTPPIESEKLDSSLATIQRFPDRLFRLQHPQTHLLHLEIQSSWESDLPQRMLEYNVFLRGQRRLPVRSVVLLLHRRVEPPASCGLLEYRDIQGQVYLRFEYDVVRVWELPGEALLEGPLGAAMLGLLTKEAQGRAEEWTRRFIRRVEREARSREQATALLDGAYILLGLLYDGVEIARWFAEAQGMKESSTYQRILDEGRAEGQVLALRENVLLVYRERFGEVPGEVEAKVRGVEDVERLRGMLVSLLRVQRPEELQW
jgi:predicted transposase YdaD